MSEQTVDTSELSASLNELIKAANATKLVKGEGVSIDNSGTMSDGKSSGGGQGSMSDAGGLDDLMIAKMSAAGVDAATLSAFRAFMSHEEPDADDEGGESDDDEDDEMEGKMAAPPEPPFSGGRSGGFARAPRPSPKGGTQKSKSERGLSKAMDQFRSDGDIEEALDVSPFLEAITARTAEMIDGMRKSHRAAAVDQGKVNAKMAAAMYQIGSLLKSQAQVIDTLRSRLGIVERAPVAVPRGATTQSKALAKSMPGEVGGQSKQLSKSEVVSALSYMNLEKGMREINGVRTSELVGRLEGGNVLDQGTLDAVAQFLRANPAEASSAKAYQ